MSAVVNFFLTLKFRKFFLHLVSNHKLYTTTITTVPKNLRRPALSTRLLWVWLKCLELPAAVLCIGAELMR